MLWTINMAQTGTRIKELRTRSGYTVKTLQEAMSPISCQAIYKWQEGMALPSIDNLVVLSALFQVPIDQIIVRESVCAVNE